VQGIIAACGLGIGTGTSSLLARNLGERKQENVNRSAGTSVFMILAMWAVFALMGLFLMRPFFRAQTTDSEIIELGTTYITICCTLCVGQLAQMVFERHLQATGHSGLSMIAQMSGAITNIILDPFFIFGIGFFPRLEVKGAAIATVIGQVLSGVVALVFCLKYNKEVPIKLRHIRYYRSLVREISKIGAASFFMMALTSVMTFGVNKMTIAFSVSATSAYAAYHKIQALVFVPMQGMGSAVIPVISYNYGAGKIQRIKGTIKVNLAFNTAYMLLFTAIFFLFPGQLLALFNPSEEMYAYGCTMLRTIAVGFVFMGVSIAFSTPLQVLHYWKLSIFVSIYRQAIPVLPLMYLLSLTGNIDIMWMAIPIVEITGSIISTIGFMSLNKKVINAPAKLPDKT
jgi:putative MATE family efflux protein